MRSFPMIRQWPIVFVLLCMMALGACQTVQTTRSGTVGVERRQAMMLSPEEVNRGAEKAYQQTMAQAARKGALNRDAAQVARVRAVTRRLIPATGTFRGDAPAWQWEINVISSPEVNAWCMPGGKIAVYSGILDKLHLSDDELAAVLGHEIAHALREHGRERASQKMAQQMAVDVLGAAVGLGGIGSSIADVVADVTIGLPYSRAFEREADRIGVELAARAGYDPRAAVTLWRKMSQAGGGQPLELLSSHPSDESRIRDLQNYSAQVLPLYEASRRR